MLSACEFSELLVRRQGLHTPGKNDRYERGKVSTIAVDASTEKRWNNKKISLRVHVRGLL
jgi:hypothetical protein